MGTEARTEARLRQEGRRDEDNVLSAVRPPLAQVSAAVAAADHTQYGGLSAN